MGWEMLVAAAFIALYFFIIFHREGAFDRDDRNYPFRIIRKSAPTPHICDLPDFWDRRRLGLKLGAIVRCKDCEIRYEWGFIHYGDGGKDWVRVDD